MTSSRPLTVLYTRCIRFQCLFQIFRSVFQRSPRSLLTLFQQCNTIRLSSIRSRPEKLTVIYSKLFQLTKSWSSFIVSVQIPVDWCVHSRISGAPILKYRCADSILNGALSFIMNNETRSLQVEKGAPNAKILNHHWRD